MCGICGLVAYAGVTNSDRDAVQGMVHSQLHRGPDAQGITEWDACILGHDRLAIIDLSDKAAQPMLSADGRFAMVFNGEIYNFPELRRELEHSGHVFRSTSDTEVLLEHFALHGPAILPRLNGMFAFAVWDIPGRRLTLARDRFGQKPLYHTSFDGRFAFASEVMALFRHPQLPRQPNLNAIYHYLTLQSVPAPLCAFDGVHKLSPGHWLELTSGGTPVITRYWSPDSVPAFTGDANEAEEELDARLQRAVARHLISDVPVGVFLSGGVDSSLVAALCPCDIQAFSVRFGEAGFDESPFAVRAARHCGVPLSMLVAEADLASQLPDMARHFGEPFGDSSALATWALCAATRQHVTVALSGDGGDDIFNGYARHIEPFLFDGAPVPASVSAMARELECGMAETVSPAAARYTFRFSYFCGEHKRRLCGPELRAAASPPLSRLLLRDMFGLQHPEQLLDTIRRVELDHYLAATLMPKVDITAMAASLEVRMPLLDAEVADLAFGLPARLRVRRTPDAGSFANGWEAKWLLKKVACRHLPRDLVYRRKHGFSVPLDAWLRGPLAEMLHGLLLDEESHCNRWLDRHELQRTVKDFLGDSARHGHRVWALLMLELWARNCLTPTA